MPTYEYECTKCGHTFEAFQSMTDKPLSRCPVCKSAIRRVINGGLGVIFKGSGFYSTDNKKGSALTGGSGNGNSSRDKEKSSDSSGNGSSEKSSSEKPAEKSSAEKTGPAKKSPEKTAAS
jgi:putative FmdB family regulatory protein